MNETETRQAIDLLNGIMELELAGVVRYTHYSLMVFGYSRIPVVDWMDMHCSHWWKVAHRCCWKSMPER